MRIVLVDPSRAIQRAMTDLIVRGEHEVLAFSEGQKALDCIGSDDGVRALITSVHLPDISGIQLCAAAREIAGSRRALFIVVMSSTEDYGLAIQALDNGADDFIRKPPFPEELRARLRAADRLTVMQRDLIKYATTDFLTGLLNRRAFFNDAAEACHAAAGGKPLSAIMFDIDHFKRINDTHGHEMGDIVLANVSSIAKAAGGMVGRLGGEEFCLLEHCDLGDAIDCSEGLRRSIKTLRFPQLGLSAITCSFGVAEWESGDTVDRLLQRADMAMYEAKRTGRDRVVAADTFPLTDQHEARRGIARVAKRRNRLPVMPRSGT
jgi:two-component system, cell cycle response regulator